MITKWTILLYVQHWGYDPCIRQEMELEYEPSDADIKGVIDAFKPADGYDIEIDCTTGAILPPHMMPRKSKIQRVYVCVEKRFYKSNS